jgi:hypothetical protein
MGPWSLHFLCPFHNTSLPPSLSFFACVRKGKERKEGRKEGLRGFRDTHRHRTNKATYCPLACHTPPPNPNPIMYYVSGLPLKAITYGHLSSIRAISAVWDHAGWDFTISTRRPKPYIPSMTWLSTWPTLPGGEGLGLLWTVGSSKKLYPTLNANPPIS